MRWTNEEFMQRVAAIPEQAKDHIICMMARYLFGDIETEGNDVVSFIDTSHVPDRGELKDAATYLSGAMIADRPVVTVNKVIRSGELAILPGHTFDDIGELACEHLNAACSWDICGEILFLGSDGHHYVGTVEFVIAPGNPAYVGEVLTENKDNDQNGD